MKTKVLSLCLTLLTGMSAWAQETITVSIYDDCSKNGQTIYTRPTGQENGHTWVDLGLPSGLKWATCNVGATTPGGYGNYYAWGETEPKDDYSWATYKYADGDNKVTKYCVDFHLGNKDDKTTLDPEDDAAHVNWGGCWRMPTDAEWTELRENCTWTWTAQNGYLVASKTNSNSIFLPAAGHYDGDGKIWFVGVDGVYWSSSLYKLLELYACRIVFGKNDVFNSDSRRSNGYSVRSVCPFPTNVLTLNIVGCENTNTIRCDAGQKISINAVPKNAHRHFVRWTDGNTDNPRTVIVTQDTAFTAEFAIDQYTITASGEHGTVEGAGTYDYNTKVYLTAVPDKGYYFVKWSNGMKYNPYYVYVRSDTTLTAEFAPYRYTITTYAQNGSVSGGGTYDYGTTITLTATADEHYHFTQWSDGNTDNPRTVSVEGDATYTAEFRLDQITISATCDPQQGTVTGAGTYDYGTQVTLTAVANKGYEFAQWSNGVTDNPYLLTATEDLALEAQFVPATAVENVSADGTTPKKVFRDGQVYILRNGKTYTTTGVEVK